MDTFIRTYPTFAALRQDPIITLLETMGSNVLVRVEGKLSERLENSSNQHFKIVEIAPNYNVQNPPTPLTYIFTYV